MIQTSRSTAGAAVDTAKPLPQTIGPATVVSYLASLTSGSRFQCGPIS